MKKNDMTKDELIKELKALKLKNSTLKTVYEKDISDRIFAEESRRESEEKYRALVDSSTDGIVIYCDGKIVFANPSSVSLMRASNVDQLLGKPVTELVHPAYREKVINRMKEMNNTGKAVPIIEEIFLRFDGTEVEVEVKAVPIIFDKKPAIQIIARDITERKKAEEKLNYERNLLLFLLDNTPDLIYFKDRESRFIRISKAQAEKFGLKEPTLAMGKTDFDFFTEEHALPAFEDEMEIMRSRKSIVDLEEKETWPDGSVTWVLTNKLPLRNNEGEIIGTFGVSRDITERKRAEETIEENEKKYKELFYNAPIGYHELDSQGRIAWINHTELDMLGYTEEEMIGQYVWKFVEDENVSQQRVLAKLKGTLPPANGQESVFRRKDKTTIPILVGEIILRDATDSIIGIRTTIHDITERKLFEESLKKQKEEFETIFNLVPAQIWYKDTHNNHIRVNRQVCKDIGKTKDQIEGHSAEELFPQFAQKYYKDDLEVINSGKPKLGIIEKMNMADGEIRWIITDKIPEFGKDGDVTGLIAVVQDITEKKRAEEELQWKTAFLEALVNSSIDGILVIDNHEKKILQNQKCIDLWKIPQNIVEQNDDAVQVQYVMNRTKYPEQFVEKVRYLYDHADEISHDEIEFKDGMYLERYSSPVLGQDGSNYGRIWAFREITERKFAENELRKFSRAVEQSPASIIISDTKGNIEYVNPKTIGVTGYQLSEILGKNPRMFSSGEKPKNEYKNMWETIISGKEWRGEFHNKKKNGELYWENALISPIKNEKGEITNFIAIKEDITQQKIMIDELVKEKDKAEEMNRLKSSFFANMSHELRTPLIGINGFSEFLVESLKDPELKDMAENILKSGNRLSETLNLILDITKFESDRMDFKLEPVELVSETEELINSFKNAARKKRITITTSFSSTTIYLNTDRRAYRTVINNLINNAIKFTREGEIMVSVTSKDNFIEIKVIDTGIGIAKKDQGIIFEEFRQASEGYKRNFEGTGLGLSITKKIAEKFGGNIVVESELGKGSIFIVKLPITEEAEIMGKLSKEIKDKKLAELVSVKPATLLIDDDPLVFNVIKRYIVGLAELEWASDAEIAIKLLKNKKYDIVFMDINLKHGLDGVQATKEIRKMTGYENIPIIAITAYAMDGDKEEFLAAGCSHYLSKPFTKQGVLSLMEDVLRSINKV